MRLAGYIRVSRVNGREGDTFISPDQQRDKIEQWARLRGVEIVAWYTDLDKSGGKLSRPEFDKALESVGEGTIDGVVVARLDRFSRAGVADALKLIESIEEAGGQVASVEEGVDPTTPFGEFARTIFLALARMQRQQIAANWKDSQRRAVERGVHIASKTPTGYRPTIVGHTAKGEPIQGPLEADPHAAPHIAEVFEMKATGASWKDLALYLREHNVESPYGTTNWQPRALSHLIANRVYLGEARSGEFTNPDAHEPIVEAEVWTAAQEAKGERPVNGFGGAMLSRVLHCGGCGRPLKADTMRDRDGTKLRLYRCRGEDSTGRCPAPASVLGRVIEPFVVDVFFARLEGRTGLDGLVMADELHRAEVAVERAEVELATYMAAVSAADVGAEAFAVGARQRRGVVDRVREDLDRRRERAGLADLPRAADLEPEWSDLDVHQRNRMLRRGLEKVVLRRGRVSIEQRTRVIWKGESEEANR